MALVAQVILVGLGFPLSQHDETLSAVLITLIAGCGMVACGLYNRGHIFHWDDLVTRSVVVMPLLAVAMIVPLWLDDRFVIGSFQRGHYILCFATMAAFLVAFLTIRYAFVAFIGRTGAFTRKVLIIGSGPRAGKIEKLGSQHHDLSFSVNGYVRLTDSRDTPLPHPRDRRGIHRREDYSLLPSELPQFCADNKVEELIVASTERRGLPVRELLACKLAGVTITEYATFWEREARQIDLDAITPSWLVFSDGFRVGPLRSFVKRTFDIGASVLLLTLTLPVTILTAILIKLESHGPIFYQQERIGKGGKPYNILKFRSMCENAEKDGPRWADEKDKRVTRIGRFIRKVRIDEIPQVINVLKGEMAFVGPRPERGVFVTALTEKIPYYMERHAVKPGITGWAQINYPYGATEEDAKMKLSYDLYYVKNGSIFLDILILIQTVKVLLWNSGAR